MEGRKKHVENQPCTSFFSLCTKILDTSFYIGRRRAHNTWQPFDRWLDAILYSKGVDSGGGESEPGCTPRGRTGNACLVFLYRKYVEGLIDSGVCAESCSQRSVIEQDQG